MSKKHKKGGRQRGQKEVRHARSRAEARGAPEATAGTTGVEATPEPAGSAEASARTGPTAAPASRPPRWWERFPGRKEFELEELTRAGLDPILASEDPLVVRVTISFAGAHHAAEIRYPDLYPYTRCEVVVPTLTLPKHQNPYGHNLCLLDRSTGAWDVRETAAWLIASQLPRIEEAVADPSTRPDLEVPQAEPVSFYFEGSCEADSLIFVPTEAATLPASYRGGTLQVVTVRDGDRLRGAVTAIDQLSSTTVTPMLRSLRGGASRAVEWIRLPAPPASLAEIQRIIDGGAFDRSRLREGDLSAVAFPEETVYGQHPELAWLFIRWHQTGRQLNGTLVRAERFDPAEQALRIPHLAGLSHKRIALFGLGGIGAPIAHLLLQMRTGELRVVDHDLVRAGNAVRWPLGLSAAGLTKVEALARLAQREYPETKVEPVRWRIGGSALGNAPDEATLLEQTLQGVDLVVDATAESGLQYLLTDAARERGLPIITAEGRAGGYGGIVVRYRPDRTGCYLCFKLHQQDGRFAVLDDPAGRFIQPRGCADPTFTGAAFDLTPVGSLTARLAAQTLVPSDAFPDAAYDVALLYNREAANTNVPRWEYSRLERHAGCQRCASSAS